MKEKYIVPVLTRCGYYPHPKGHHHGYIKNRGRTERWHAYWFENNLEIHLDITISGKHKVAKLFRSLEEEHRKEILVIRAKISQENKAKCIPKRQRRRLEELAKYGPGLSKEETVEKLKEIHQRRGTLEIGP